MLTKSQLWMKMLDPKSKWEELERKRRRIKELAKVVEQRALPLIAVSPRLRPLPMRWKTVEMKASRSKTSSSCDRPFKSFAGALIHLASQLTSLRMMLIA